MHGEIKLRERLSLAFALLVTTRIWELSWMGSCFVQNVRQAPAAIELDSH
jgi:hypothetical protein